QQKPSTWDQYLRCYRRHKRGKNTGKIPGCLEIAGRPAEANERRHIGHWEGDTMVGTKRQGTLVTLVDRKSRYVLLAPAQDGKARRARYKLQHLLGSLPSQKRRSVPSTTEVNSPNMRSSRSASRCWSSLPSRIAPGKEARANTPMD